MPYTYLIGWSTLDKWYYGVRYSKLSHPNELWKTYFTSSKHVKQFRELHGEPDILEIRRLFESKESAINWESGVLTKLNVIDNDKWLNKTNNKAIPLSYSMHGWSEDSRKKMSETRTGMVHSSSTKKKISMAHKGREVPWLKGKKRPEHSRAMSGSGNSRALRIEYRDKIYGTLKEFALDIDISVYRAKKLININEAKILNLRRET